MYFRSVVLGLTLALSTLPAIAQDIIPWPDQAKLVGGRCTFDRSTRIVVQNPSLQSLGQLLSYELRDVIGLHPAVVTGASRDGDISLDLDTNLKREDYSLSIDKNASLHGANYNAVEMGTVSLLQLLKSDGGVISAPKIEIHDGPKLEFNGYLIGNFDPIPQTYEFILYCQFNKIRYFNIWLSGDSAWLFPSKAYPQLGKDNWGWAGGPKPIMFTMDQLKDLVAFADAHGVTIVPGFQTLGHSDSMRLTMPDVFDLPEHPGGRARMAMVNITNEAAYPVFDTLIGEMCDVFKSSPYIHIGGDEVNTAVMAANPQVQAYLKAHNMPSMWNLITQHYWKMDAIAKKYGKRIIAWEPQVDFGDLPPDMLAMPWTGNNITAEYVKHRTKFINAVPGGLGGLAYQNPWDVGNVHLTPGEPLLRGAIALNWATGLDETYGAAIFNEPIYNPDAKRGVDDFLRRAAIVNPVCDKLMYGFAFDQSGQLPPTTFDNMNPVFAKQLTLTLDCPKGGQVRYTLDGSPVTGDSKIYVQPIVLSESTTLRAKWFGDAGATGPHFSRYYKRQPFIQHDAIGAKVMIDPPNPGYYSAGAKVLTDGFISEKESCGEVCYLGWMASPTITIDLAEPKEARNVYIHFLAAEGGIKLPKMLDLQASEDGKTFTSIAKFIEDDGLPTRGWFGLKLATPHTYRSFKILAELNDSWIFTDEFLLNADLPGPTLLHAAMSKPITVVNPPENPDARTGNVKTPPLSALVDGYVSNSPDWNNPEWLTFRKDLDATIDLGQETAIHEVSATFMQHNWAGFKIPQTMNVLVSDDGKTFIPLTTITQEPIKDLKAIQTLSAKFEDAKGRYVRVVVPVKGKINVDEIVVNPQAGR